MDASGRRATHFRAIWAIGLAFALFGFQATRPEPVRAEWAATLDVSFLWNDNVGDGSGRVTSDDGYIDCSWNGDFTSGDCREVYTGIADFIESISVTLYIDPNVSSFACANDATNCGSRDQTLTRTVTFLRGGDDDKTATVSFTLSWVNVYGLIYGNGSVDTGGGQACDPILVTICRSYIYGRTVTWTAIPGTGSNFSYWVGAPCDAKPLTAACTFTVTGTTHFTLQFGLWRVTVRSDGKGTTCVVGHADVCSGADASRQQWFQAGQTIGVTASPAAGWRFDHWNNGKCAGQDATCVFTLNSNSTATAFYVPIPKATPTPTPKPTPKPTAKPTAKPTPKPSAGSTVAPAPSLEPTPAASVAPEPSVGPEPISSPEPPESPPPVAVATTSPGAVATSPEASPAPAPAASTGEDELPVLGLLVAGLGIGLGLGALLAVSFMLGRRGRSRASGGE